MASAKQKSEKKQARRRKARLRQKQLIALESLLLLRWILRYVETLIKEQDWSPWIQITVIMLMIAGAFGWFLFFIQRTAESSVESTHRIVERMPIPVPMLIVHTCIFALLFIAYAWQLGFIEEIQRDAEFGVHQVID